MLMCLKTKSKSTVKLLTYKVDAFKREVTINCLTHVLQCWCVYTRGHNQLFNLCLTMLMCLKTKSLSTVKLLNYKVDTLKREVKINCLTLVLQCWCA